MYRKANIMRQTWVFQEEITLPLPNEPIHVLKTKQICHGVGPPCMPKKKSHRNPPQQLTAAVFFGEWSAPAHLSLSFLPLQGCPTKTTQATSNVESRSRASRTPSRGAQSAQQHQASPPKQTSGYMKVGSRTAELNTHTFVPSWM